MLSNHFNTKKEFTHRHIGPREHEVQDMLKELGFSNLEEMADKVLPRQIRTKTPFTVVGEGLSEFDLLNKLKTMMSKNKIFKSFLGMGYYDTITPAVIQRNILENPVWYTAYTPYQAEIAQGRLESLLNFQTMITDLTGLEISNASLLDEGTAAAEAMSMAAAISKNPSQAIVVSPDLHPHVIEVLQTRAEPLGIKIILEDARTYNYAEKVFAVFVSYPDTKGALHDYKDAADKAHQNGALVIAATDLLALTLLTPPGEWGADIAVGTSQRFGVPMGFGGPHAAFLATRDAHKRLMPGRIVGVSMDANGGRALRLALQTREQHIRREKATSNICTAQVLLANMAAMYAVYHGPQGLKKIAQRVHLLATTFSEGLKNLGLKTEGTPYFDTVAIHTASAETVLKKAADLGLNLRKYNNNMVTVSFDETHNEEDVVSLLKVFSDHKVQLPSEEICAMRGAWPEFFVRKSSYLTHAVFNSHHSETELLRYIHKLQNKDITLTHSMIPLGSCTMKLNATTELLPVSWPEISKLHPFAPTSQAQGLLEMIKNLEQKLCDITGFSAVSLQPNAGSQGEYAGLLTIRKYHLSRGEAHRKICLIPSSAHGTNPASAVMAGMEVVVVNCDDQGNVQLSDLKEKALKFKDTLAALMVTYPSTHGVFEEAIVEICNIIHEYGGQVYMDGANMNALVGLSRPGEFGADVSHMNLHKTFAIPHGGGGPGVGPIGVRAHLAPFLPRHSMTPEAGPSTGVSATTSAPWGSASILPISWSYITMMGVEGLQRATLVSILSANYLAKKLSPHYPIVYKGNEGLVAHECIIDLRGFKKTSDVDVTDVAKRLMDYGFHAPTMSWPVVGTLMIEPTESEPKAELDRFVDAMIAIRHEISDIENKKVDAVNNPLKNSPHTAQFLMKAEWNHPYTREQAAYPLAWVRGNKIFPAVARVDNAYGDRNLVCSCPPLDDYQK